MLPQDESESFALLRRKYDLEERRLAFQWQHVDGLPSSIKTELYQHLPKDAKLQVISVRCICYLVYITI